jgi:hypothetical protein
MSAKLSHSAVAAAVEATGNDSPISRVSVPLLFNGGILEGIDYESKNITVGELYKRFLKHHPKGEHRGRIDFHPPYQREDSVWSKEKKQAYIGSLANGVPVPPVFLCPKEPGQQVPMMYPIDALQRLTCLFQFFTNQFPVKVKIERQNGEVETRSVKWEVIEENDDYLPIREAILDHEVDLVILEWVDLRQQRKIFVALNNGVPLNEDENNYCANYLSRKLFYNILWGKIFGGSENVFSPNMRANRRYRSTRTVNEILMLVCTDSRISPASKDSKDGNPVIYNPNGDPNLQLKKGTDLSGACWIAPALRKQERSASASAVHFALEELGVEFHHPDKEFLKPFDLDCVSLLREVVDFLGEIFINKPDLGRDEEALSNYLNPRNLIDPAAFFYWKVKLGHIKMEDLRASRRKVTNLLEEYFKGKTDKNYKMATSDAITISKKMNLLESLFRSKL